MTRINAKATPIYDTGYSCHITAINLFNQSYAVHIMPYHTTSYYLIIKLKKEFLRHVYLFIDIITRLYLTNLSQISCSSFLTEINISVEAVAALNSLNTVISTPTVSYITHHWCGMKLHFALKCSVVFDNAECQSHFCLGD